MYKAVVIDKELYRNEVMIVDLVEINEMAEGQERYVYVTDINGNVLHYTIEYDEEIESFSDQCEENYGFKIVKK